MAQTYDVFISYSRKDKNFATKLARKLTEWGYSYWIDVDGIESGDMFKKKIIKAINDSKVFLFVSSANSNNSVWTLKEIGFAIEKHKTIIPICIDDTQFNDDLLFDLRDLDRIDCLSLLEYSGSFERLHQSLIQHLEDTNSISTPRVKPSIRPWRNPLLIGVLSLLGVLIVTIILVFTLKRKTPSAGPSVMDESTFAANREKAIVGMWRCDYDDDYSIRTYYEDGTGIEEHRFYRKSQEYESKSIYYIDQKDNKMKIVDSYIDDYDGQRYTQEYTVAYINDYEMRLDGHKGPHIYHRIK